MASRGRRRKVASSEAAGTRGADFVHEYGDAVRQDLSVPALTWHQEQKYEIADASSISPSQAIPVVGVPNYPNCLKWSNENLLAAGAGHLVTILDPACLSGPRGFIPVTTGAVFDIGRVPLEDLHSHSLLQTCLSRDPRPIVRSIDWSPPGLAQNGGSLLAVCTTDGRVKVYREPFCDFQSEWVETQDLTEMLFKYCVSNDFTDAESAAIKLAMEEATIPPPLKWGFKLKRRLSEDEEPQHRKKKKTTQSLTDEIALVTDCRLASVENDGVDDTVGGLALGHSGMVSMNTSIGSIQKGSRVEVLEEENELRLWVDGLVLDIIDREVLVQLDPPQYESKQKWIPFDIPCDLNDNITAGEVPLNSASQMQRPRVRPRVAMETLDKWTAGDGTLDMTLMLGVRVEAWLNNAWQEGVIVEVSGSEVVVNFAASLSNSIIQLDKLRCAPCWRVGKRVWNFTNGSADSRQEAGGLGIRNGPNSDSGEDAVQQPIATIGNHDAGLKEGQKLSLMAGEDRPIEHQTVEMDVAERSMTAPTPSGPEEGSDGQQSTDTVGNHDDGLQEGQQLSLKGGEDRSKEYQNATMHIAERSMTLHTPSGPEQGTADSDEPQQVEFIKDKHGKFVKGVGGMSKGRGIKRTGVSRLLGKRGKLFHPRNQGSDLNGNWISAHEYAARSELLTPLVVAWSPRFPFQGLSDRSERRATQSFALLGTGMKSGKVAIWKMAFPPKYAIDHAYEPMATELVGFLDSHDSWVSNISWAGCCNFHLEKLNARGNGRSSDSLLLATGCVDGSVKLWAGLSSELVSAPVAANSVAFMLLGQVIMAESVPITALELFVPPRQGSRALLAVGNASGSVVVWELKSEGDFHQICSQRFAHQQMVTGFSWAPDGWSLYSCGQDSLKRWDFSQDQLLQLPFPDSSEVFPPNTPSDICGLEALESYFGITLSPNGLALAAMRGVANDLLDQMYQARSQKGMLQLFWLGNEHVNVTVTNRNISSAKSIPGLQLVCWEMNVIEALEDLQDASRALVLWDVVKSLSSLKDRVGVEGVVSILSKWVSSWTARQQPAVGHRDSYELSIPGLKEAIPGASCRRLQMLNVIIRCIFFSHVRPDILNTPASCLGMEKDDAEMQLWKEGVVLLEHELRQRLVYINLHRTTRGVNILEGNARDDMAGAQLLAAWVLGFDTSMVPQLTKFAAELCKSNLFAQLGAESAVETCTLCDSKVPLESPEMGVCSAAESKHQLSRCSVSMQVCPAVCLWHCGCCRRSAVKQAPALFFSLLSRDHLAEVPFFDLEHSNTLPFCPFCGILMHRLLPNFFLTPSLV